MADPLGGPRVDIIGDFEMRKYKRGESSSSRACAGAVGGFPA
jgi:hypothetical protein